MIQIRVRYIRVAYVGTPGRPELPIRQKPGTAFEFLDTKSKENAQSVYVIHTVRNGRLINIGLSVLVELTIPHYEVKP